MRPKALLFAFAVFAAPGLAGAQDQDKEKEKKEERPAAPSPRLNLRLDNPAQYTRETPREGGAGVLPSLGADARPMPTTPTPTSNRPFPKDTERGEY